MPDAGDGSTSAVGPFSFDRETQTMAVTVHKYVIDPMRGADNFVSIMMPLGARPLSACQRPEGICTWFMVNTDQPLIERRIAVVGTGFDMDHIGEYMSFIGTVFLGELVIHVYDLGEFGEPQ